MNKQFYFQLLMSILALASWGGYLLAPTNGMRRRFVIFAVCITVLNTVLFFAFRHLTP